MLVIWINLMSLSLILSQLHLCFFNFHWNVNVCRWFICSINIRSWVQLPSLFNQKLLNQYSLQSFTLSKDDNVFIYFSKTSMSSVIYTFKTLQCLHLHFKDFNVFCLLQDSMSLCFKGLDVLYFYALKKEKRTLDVFCSTKLQYFLDFKAQKQIGRAHV